MNGAHRVTAVELPSVDHASAFQIMPAPRVAAIASGAGIPECGVDGVELAGQLQWFRAQRRPGNAIRRGHGVRPAGTRGDPLEALFIRTGGIGIDEGRGNIGKAADLQDVVPPRLPELDHPQFRPREGDAVAAGRQRQHASLLLALQVENAGPVIEAPPVIPAEEAIGKGDAILPGRIKGHSHLTPLGSLQLQPRAVQLRDEQIIDKEFAAGADIDGAVLVILFHYSVRPPMLKLD